MRTFATLALTCAAIAAQAQVTFTGPFTTAAIWMEGFDTTAAGTYNAFPVFGTPAFASRIGTSGALVVRPLPGTPSAPHFMYGDGVDARIVTGMPMRRFGGWFSTGFIGAISPTATFVFYDAANNLIGSQTVTLNATWQWYGFKTNPKWRRVDIIGATPGIQGNVGMDSLTIRPN